MTFSIDIQDNYTVVCAECRYAVSQYISIHADVLMQKVIMLNVIILTVIMLNVVMSNVVARFRIKVHQCKRPFNQA
jgi:hypothetical protein